MNSVPPVVCASANYLGRWPSAEQGAYIDLFRNLAGAIRHGEELMVKWEEAATVIEIIELAYRSSKERRTLDVPPSPTA